MSSLLFSSRRKLKLSMSEDFADTYSRVEESKNLLQDSAIDALVFVILVCLLMMICVIALYIYKYLHSRYNITRDGRQKVWVWHMNNVLL